MVRMKTKNPFTRCGKRCAVMATLLLLVFLLGSRGANGAVRNEIFSPVSSLVRDVENDPCFLSSTYVRGASRLTCGALCMSNALCHGFCIEVDMCHLYRTSVRNTATITLVPMGDKQCYSDWPRSNALPYVAVASSPPTVYYHTKDVAAHGYYCHRENNNCFKTDDPSGKWWLADLGERRNIGSVRIRTSRAGSFSQVSVRVGNATASGNFANYAQLGYYSGSTLTSVVVVIEGQAVLNGRFVAMSSPGARFNLCEVQILSP